VKGQWTVLNLLAELMERSKYKHIIWDWNGTLLDDAWLCVDVINGVLSRRNMSTISLRQYQELFNFPVIDYYVRLGFDFEKESFEIVGTEFIDNYEKRRHEVNLQKGAKAVLKSVREADLTQSLLSASLQTTLTAKSRSAKRGWTSCITVLTKFSSWVIPCMTMKWPRPLALIVFWF